jgi:hypothetical protein
MLRTQFLFWILACAPPGDDAYAQSQLDLELAAASIANLPPAESIEKLQAALAETLRHPEQLHEDPGVADRLATARMALVWAYLTDGNLELATSTMDLALRSAGGRPLPLSGLGPNVRKLHDERKLALEAAGTATILVDCDGCEVLIDEAQSELTSAPLLLGMHRVWVFDGAGLAEPMFEGVALDEVGITVTVTYRPTPVEVEALPAEPPRPTPPQKKQPKVPRWVKITGMGVGAGLLIVGGVLMGLDGKCKNGSVATADNRDSCSHVWTNAGPGYSLIAIGGGVLLGMGVWLGIDETRAGRIRQASAMVGWTVRF